VNEELYKIEPYFLTNEDSTKYFLCVYTKHENERILIPISLQDVIIEKQVKVEPFRLRWVPDNLSTIEYHAKQKGLV
jgi:hypothetical protein